MDVGVLGSRENETGKRWKTKVQSFSPAVTRTRTRIRKLRMMDWACSEDGGDVGQRISEDKRKRQRTEKDVQML